MELVHYIIHELLKLCTPKNSLEQALAKITPHGPGQTLSLVGSGRVVSKFHYTNPTRPDPRTAWVSDKSADFVWS